MPVKSSTGYILASHDDCTSLAWTCTNVLPGQEEHSVLGRFLLPSKEPHVVSVTIWTDTDLKIEPGDRIGQLKMFGADPTSELVEEIVPSKNARSGQDLLNIKKMPMLLCRKFIPVKTPNLRPTSEAIFLITPQDFPKWQVW
ncbi:hypothetical protein L1887_31970 [Cichorium endivia]|nr:hypothetical protein L1887_31970 [Cichorium endivia]